MPVAVPVGAHDAAGEVEFNVIYVVVYLLPDGENEVLGAVTLLRERPAGSMSAGGSEEITGCEDARAKVLSRGEGVPPGHVYPVFDSTTTDAGYSTFVRPSIAFLPYLTTRWGMVLVGDPGT